MSNSPLELVLKESYLKVKRSSGFIVDFLNELKFVDVMNVLEQSVPGVRGPFNIREKKDGYKVCYESKRKS